MRPPVAATPAARPPARPRRPVRWSTASRSPQSCSNDPRLDAPCSRGHDRRDTGMKLSMAINYAGGYEESARQVADLESAGLDIAWIAEAYSFDAVSYMGYLAA